MSTSLTEGTGWLSLPRTPPEALPLDSAKGTQSLWNPFHGMNLLFAQKTPALRNRKKLLKNDNFLLTNDILCVIL
jgi:hypothetical protein